MSIAFAPFAFPVSEPCLKIAGVEFRMIGPWQAPPGLPGALRRAVPKRQAEFIAGRRAAGDACSLLGLNTPDLPIGPDRLPVWPGNAIGSISHSESLAVAAIGLRSHCDGVGIDVERFDEHRDMAFLVPDIVSEAEIAMLRPHFGTDQAAVLLFSAREAIYKAVSPLLSERTRFRDFCCVGGENGRLIFSLEQCFGSGSVLPQRAVVQFAAAAGHICTLCALPVQPSR